MATCVGMPCETASGAASTDASDPDVNRNVYVPAAEIFKSVKVARPFTDATVVVPDKMPVPPPGTSETVTASVAPATKEPAASRSSTTGCVVNGAAAMAPAGWVIMASRVAGSGDTVKGAESTTGVASDANWSWKVPLPLMARFVNVATPFTAVTTVVPESAPLTALSETLTVPLNDAIVALLPSTMLRTGCVGSSVPLSPPTGCCVNFNWAASTVNVTVPVLPSLDAEIVVEPRRSAVTTPASVTVAIVGSAEVHTMGRPASGLFAESCATAVSVTDWLTNALGAAGEMTMRATSAADTAIVAEPLLPSLVAVIVACPSFLAVARPVDDTVATLVSLVVHATTRPESTVFAASRVVATNWTACPTRRLDVAGVTTTLATAAGTTVTETLDPMAPTAPRIDAVPTPIARIRPVVALTETMLALLVVNCTGVSVVSIGVSAESRATAVTRAESPSCNGDAGPVTRTDLRIWRTTTDTVSLRLRLTPTMRAVPIARAVTRPVAESTVAMAVERLLKANVGATIGCPKLSTTVAAMVPTNPMALMVCVRGDSAMDATTLPSCTAGADASTPGLAMIGASETTSMSRLLASNRDSTRCSTQTCAASEPESPAGSSRSGSARQDAMSRRIGSSVSVPVRTTTALSNGMRDAGDAARA